MLVNLNITKNPDLFNVNNHFFSGIILNYSIDLWVSIKLTISKLLKLQISIYPEFEPVISQSDSSQYTIHVHVFPDLVNVLKCWNFSF